MKLNGILAASMLAVLVCTGTGCDRKDSVADEAQDALNMRDHEKLKDAGEDAKDAVDKAADGVDDAVHDRD